MTGPIHIRYVRSGGIGGLRAVANVDTGVLDGSAGSHSAHGAPNAAVAARITQLVDAVLAEPSPAPAKSARNDGFQYQLTIDKTGKRTSITASETAQSEALKQLIQLLDQMATIVP
jgi:hypothetical protein